MEEVNTRKVNDHLVEMLEQILEQAMSGDIIAVAMAGITHDACTFLAHNCHDYPTLVLGELTVLQREVMDTYVGLSRKPEEMYCEGY